MNPTKCHLWTGETPTEDNLNSAFEAMETFSEEDHLSRRLVKCKDCGQMYLKEFFEEVDWAGGDDAQHTTYIPVQDRREALRLNQGGPAELQTFLPKLVRSWPKGGEKKIFWVKE